MIKHDVYYFIQQCLLFRTTHGFIIPVHLARRIARNESWPELHRYTAQHFPQTNRVIIV